MQSTEWRPVLGYEGYYEVSNTGLVRSVERVIPHPMCGGQRRQPSRLIATWPQPSGHQCVKLYRSSHGVSKRVHRLVLEAFVGPCPEGMEGCHNDGDPTNNHISNLRWDTSLGNSADMRRHGTHWNTRKTHCKNGHEFNDANTYYRPSRPNDRVCRACLNASHQTYRASRREKGLPYV